MLPAEWDKRLVDLNVGPVSDADLRWADMVWVGAMAVQKESVRRLLGRCRSGGVKVVAGGPLFTIDGAQFPEVDHLVLNEAELTLPPFLDDLHSGRARRTYRAPSTRTSLAAPCRCGDWQTFASTRWRRCSSPAAARSTATFATSHRYSGVGPG
jgi:hypothetical protein